jgi:hypothetical protein
LRVCRAEVVFGHCGSEPVSLPSRGVNNSEYRPEGAAKRAGSQRTKDRGGYC